MFEQKARCLVSGLMFAAVLAVASISLSCCVISSDAKRFLAVERGAKTRDERDVTGTRLNALSRMLNELRVCRSMYGANV